MAERPTIFVTGGNGQVGSALARLAPDDVLAFSRNDLDISQPQMIDKVLDRHRPSVVINAAAYTHVDRAESEPDEAFGINAVAPEFLAEACSLRDIPLIHLSTDFVFDGNADRPYRESDIPNPINVYGESKLAGEERIRDILPKHFIIRTSWVFARGFPNFVTAIRKLAAERESIRVVTDQIGSPTPAEALAKALLVLAEKVQAPDVPWGTYHLAGSPSISRFEWAKMLVENTKCRVEPAVSEDFPAPAKRPVFSALDSSLMLKTFGVQVGDWREYVRTQFHGVAGS